MRKLRHSLRNHQRAYAKRVDIVIATMIKSQRFVPKSDAARAGWCALDWTEITESATFPLILRGGLNRYGDLRVSYHQAMAEENFLCLLLLLWVKTRIQGGLRL